jgi:ELWxxDGT repeat protein
MSDRGVSARVLASWSLALALVAAPAVSADRVERVKDINTNFLTGLTSYPAYYFDAGGGVAYFMAYQPAIGRELWRTDGTDSGTYLLKDINPGTADSEPHGFAMGNGFAYFVARDPVYGDELWRTDGTAAGTTLVKDVWPGTGGSGPTSLFSIDGTVFFNAYHPTYGRELWKSDGTAEGTVLVKDVNYGVSYSSPLPLANIGGVLYFRADDGAHGVELWRTDGTDAGTVLVKDVNPGVNSGNPGSPRAFGGATYFSADDGVTGQELWKTDGTTAGTTLVRDFRAGVSASNPWLLGELNGSLFLSLDDGLVGRELWKSDGTAAGTTLVRDIRPGTAASSPTGAGVVNGWLLFEADDGVTGGEIWRTDGTTAGTVRVADVWPGFESGVFGGFIVLGNQMIFEGGGPSTWGEMWRTDGTAAGTYLLRDIRPGSEIADINFAAKVGNQVIFGANDGVHGREPWRTDGTPAGTVMVRDVYSGAASGRPTDLTVVGANLYFAADNGTGLDLWRSDGTETGTFMVKDVTPPGGPTTPIGELTKVGSTLYFFAWQPTIGAELFKSDGTAAGTVLVKDLCPGTCGLPEKLTDINGTLYFVEAAGLGSELYKSDGTSAGTVLVKDIVAGTTGSLPSELTPFQGQVFFSANEGGIRSLYKSDGTAAGTGRVATGAVVPRNVKSLTVVNGHTLFFVADDGPAGAELWRSDGTSAGTYQVVDIRPGISSNPDNLTAVGNTLYFTADDGLSGAELWKTDGTVSGTVMVTDLNPGLASSSPQSLLNVLGTLYFGADDGVTGRELWKTDGTPAGTSLVEDIAPGPDSSNPRNPIHVNGTLFFTANGPEGAEMWRSDGLPGGTHLVADIEDGPSPSSPSQYTPFFIAAGSQVYFTAYTGDDGTELRVLRNLRPFADAGPDVSIASGETATLNASGSTDPDGDLLGYQWQGPTGPPFSTSPSVVVSPTTTTQYFLTVHDGFGGVAADVVTVNVVAGPADLVVRVDGLDGGIGTVSVDPPGAICDNLGGSPQACPYTYGQGETVTLVASPVGDSVFIGWSGACMGTDPTCTLTASAGQDTMARFRGPQSLMVVADSFQNGFGAVRIAPPDVYCSNMPGSSQACENFYRVGSTVTLEAWPSPDSVFLGWGGLCSGLQPTCQVLVEQASGVTATFRGPQSLVVVVDSFQNGFGAVRISPPDVYCSNAPGSSQACENFFRVGSTVTLEAWPSPDSVFLGWGGLCSGLQPTCQVLVEQASGVTATFRGPQGLTLRLVGTEGATGRVDISTGGSCVLDGQPEVVCTSTHRPGTILTLGSFVGEGSVLVGWTGCSATTVCVLTMDEPKDVTVTFRVNHPPVAHPGGPYSARRNVAIAFDGTGSTDVDGDFLFHEWDFGDGTTGTGPNPTHAYAALGTYTVTLRVHDGRVQSAPAATTVAIVNGAPVASVGGPYAGTHNAPITFDATGSSDPDGDGLAYSWTFGDGGTGTGPNPSHTYAADGTFTVVVQVSDGVDTTSASTTVTVTNQAPVPSAGGPYSGTHGVAVGFDASASTDSNGDALTFTWTFGDGGSASGPTPSHTYSADGTYTATVAVSDGVDTVTASATVTIANALPVARPGGPYTGFKNAPFVLDGTASTDGNGDALTYRWDFGDGTTGTGPAPSHTYDMPPGYYAFVYNVTLVVNDGFGDSAPVVTTVQVKDHLPVARPGGPYTTYRNQPVTLDGSASSDEDGDALTYQWDFGDGTTGTGATPTHTYSAFGNYLVRLLVNDGYMDSAPAFTQVTVPDRRPFAHAGGPYAGVRGQAITFDGSASSDPDGGPLTYQWDFGDGTTGTGVSPTHVYTAVGSFVARLVVSDGGPQESVPSTAAVTISNRPPVANAGGPYAGSRVQAVQLNGSASSDPDGDGLSYAWNFGDGTTGTGASPTHLYTTLGTFTVSLTVHDGFTASAPVTTTVAITNLAPVANAGPDRTVVRRTTVTLDGRGSSDADGTITYSWRQLSGPAVTLTNANTSQPRFTAPNVSSTRLLDFELKVTDNNGAAAVDVVRITVIR